MLQYDRLARVAVAADALADALLVLVLCAVVLLVCGALMLIDGAGCP
jgi:hypothetical protein